MLLALLLVGGAGAAVILKRPRIGLYAIILLSPYYFMINSLLTSGRLGGLVTRFSPVDFLALFSLIGITLRMLFRKARGKATNLLGSRIPTIDLLCFAWVTISVFSVLRGVSLGNEAALRASRGPLLYILYFVAIKEFKSIVQVREFLSLLLYNSLAIGLIGMAGTAGFLTPLFVNLPVGLVGATFTRGNFFADVGLTIPNVVFLLIIIQFTKQKGRFHRTLTWLSVILNLLLLLISVTRGFWLGMMAGFLTMLFVLIRYKKVRINHVFKLIIGAIFLIIGFEVIINAIGGFSIMGSMWERVSLALVGGDERGVAFRKDEFNAYASSFLGSPIIGQGFGTPVAYFDTFQNVTFAHNEYIWILQSTGLLGAVCLYGLVFASVRKGFRYLARSSRIDLKDCICILLISMVFGLMITSITSGEITSTSMTPMLVILFAIVRNRIDLTAFSGHRYENSGR